MSPAIQPNAGNAWLSASLLELVSVRATNRIAICAMLSISQPTLKLRLADHHYKEWQIDLLCRRLRIQRPVPVE